MARKLKYFDCMTSQPTSHDKSANDFDLVKTVALVTFPRINSTSQSCKDLIILKFARKGRFKSRFYHEVLSRQCLISWTDAFCLSRRRPDPA